MSSRRRRVIESDDDDDDYDNDDDMSDFIVPNDEVEYDSDGEHDERHQIRDARRRAVYDDVMDQVTFQESTGDVTEFRIYEEFFGCGNQFAETALWKYCQETLIVPYIGTSSDHTEYIKSYMFGRANKPHSLNLDGRPPMKTECFVCGQTKMTKSILSYDLDDCHTSLYVGSICEVRLRNVISLLDVLRRGMSELHYGPKSDESVSMFMSDAISASNHICKDME